VRLVHTNRLDLLAQGASTGKARDHAAAVFGVEL